MPNDSTEYLLCVVTLNGALLVLVFHFSNCTFFYITVLIQSMFVTLMPVQALFVKEWPFAGTASDGHLQVMQDRMVDVLI